MIDVKPWTYDQGIDGLLRYIREHSQASWNAGPDGAVDHLREAISGFRILDTHMSAGGQHPADWATRSE